MGVAPAHRASWIASEPTPPDPPQTSTTWSGPTWFPSQPNIMRYAVVPTSVEAAASAHDRLLGLGIT